MAPPLLLTSQTQVFSTCIALLFPYWYEWCDESLEKPFIVFPILCVINTIWTVSSLDGSTVSSFYMLYHSRTSPTPTFEPCQKTTMAVVTSYPWPELLITIPFQIQWDNCTRNEVPDKSLPALSPTLFAICKYQ